MMIRLEQTLRLNLCHHHQIRFVQALSACLPQPYKQFVILTRGEFRCEETYAREECAAKGCIRGRQTKRIRSVDVKALVATVQESERPPMINCKPLWRRL